MKSSARHLAPYVLFALLVAVVVLTGRQLLDACALSFPGFGLLTSACPAPPSPDPVPPPDPDLARSVNLQAELSQLQRRLAMAPNCPPPPPPPPEQRVEAPPPEPQAPPAPPPAPPPARTAEKPPEKPPEKPAEKKQNCQVPRSERVVLMLDASASMEFSYNVDPALEQRLNHLAPQQPGFGSLLGALFGVPDETQQLLGQIKATPGPSRISVAKRALTKLVDDADPGVTFDFVSFSECRPPRQEGTFPPPARSRLKSVIEGVPVRNATALAKALEALPGVAPRSDKPVNVVLVSDGYDSCRGDPCAVAHSLKSARSDIRVSVVAVSRSVGDLRCIADATGGKFFEAREVGEVARLLRTAAGQQSPGNCQ